MMNIYNITSIKGHKDLNKLKKSILTHLKYFLLDLKTENKELEFKHQLKEALEIFSNLYPHYTYDEYEKFMDSYDKFKFYYNFELDNIDPKAINRLNEEEKKMINDETKYDFYLKRIMHICENIYSHGYYNLDVFRFSLETVLEQEMKEKEEQKKEEEKLKPKINLFDNFLMKISKGKLGIYITICFLFLTFIAIGSQLLA